MCISHRDIQFSNSMKQGVSAQRKFIWAMLSIIMMAFLHAIYTRVLVTKCNTFADPSNVDVI
jgi:hypothetical protein